MTRQAVRQFTLDIYEWSADRHRKIVSFFFSVLWDNERENCKGNWSFMLSTAPSLLSMPCNYNLTIFNFSSLLSYVVSFFSHLDYKHTRVPSGTTHQQSCFTDLVDTRTSFLEFDCLLLLLLLLIWPFSSHHDKFIVTMVLLIITKTTHGSNNIVPLDQLQK
jgi:hypothetical protein